MSAPTRRTLRVTAATLALALAGARLARAQGEAPPPPSFEPPIWATGSCPAAETTAAAVTSLVPRGGVGALPPAARIEISDLGESYRVTLVTEGKERVRVYRDVARDCNQRARFVAVFIVLTLMPPELLAESPVKLPPPALEPPPPVAVVPTVVAVAAPPPSARRFRLQVAAALDLAPAIADAPAIASPGAEVRFTAGGGRLGLTAGLGVEPSSGFSVGGLEARELRVPFDLGAAARTALGPLELGVEAGVAAAIFHAWGTNLVAPGSGTRLDLGGRGAVGLRFGRPSARIAPSLAVHALYFPKPYEIGTVPGGVIGHMPSLWLGATAGASMAF